MVGCLDIPTKGEIFLDGKNIAHLEESDLAQIRGKKIGFIFQKFNLVSTLTALENVALPMLFQGVPTEIRQKKAKELFSSLSPSITLDSDELAFPPYLYIGFLVYKIAKKRGDTDWKELKETFEGDLLRYKMKNGSVVTRQLEPLNQNLYNQSRR